MLFPAEDIVTAPAIVPPPERQDAIEPAEGGQAAPGPEAAIAAAAGAAEEGADAVGEWRSGCCDFTLLCFYR